MNGTLLPLPSGGSPNRALEAGGEGSHPLLASTPLQHQGKRVKYFSSAGHPHPNRPLSLQDNFGFEDKQFDSMPPSSILEQVNPVYFISVSVCHPFGSYSVGG